MPVKIVNYLVPTTATRKFEYWCGNMEPFAQLAKPYGLVIEVNLPVNISIGLFRLIYTLGDRIGVLYYNFNDTKFILILNYHEINNDFFCKNISPHLYLIIELQLSVFEHNQCIGGGGGLQFFFTTLKRVLRFSFVMMRGMNNLFLLFQ